MAKTSYNPTDPPFDPNEFDNAKLNIPAQPTLSGKPIPPISSYSPQPNYAQKAQQSLGLIPPSTQDEQAKEASYQRQIKARGLSDALQAIAGALTKGYNPAPQNPDVTLPRLRDALQRQKLAYQNDVAAYNNQLRAAQSSADQLAYTQSEAEKNRQMRRGQFDTNAQLQRDRLAQQADEFNKTLPVKQAESKARIDYYTHGHKPVSNQNLTFTLDGKTHNMTPDQVYQVYQQMRQEAQKYIQDHGISDMDYTKVVPYEYLDVTAKKSGIPMGYSLKDLPSNGTAMRQAVIDYLNGSLPFQRRPQQQEQPAAPTGFPDFRNNQNSTPVSNPGTWFQNK